MDDPGPRAHDGKRILLLEQGFLKPRRGKPVHGVELFRLHLLEQLASRGVRVRAVVERSWVRVIAERFGGEPPAGLEVVGVPNLGGVALTGSAAALRSIGSRYDAVIFGDARRGLTPGMAIAAMGVRSPRRLLFAHRRPRGAVVRVARALGVNVLAVSDHVAGGFRGGVRGRVDVLYGLPNADRFHPPTAPTRPGAGTPAPRGDDEPVRFVLLGRLPNISKGEGKALEAMRRLPADVRGRVRLHLASYIEPAAIDEPGVVAHEWIPAAEIPAFLRTMDAMLCLSSNETFSQAIVQGMLTGLPVIATSLPVFVEKLDTGAGFVADDPSAIAARMVELAGNPDLRARMGAEGRRVALERYVWDTDRFLDEFLFRES